MVKGGKSHPGPAIPVRPCPPSPSGFWRLFRCWRFCGPRIDGATETPYNKSFVDDTRFLTHLYLCWNDKIYRKVTFYRAGIRTTCYLSTRFPIDVMPRVSHGRRSRLQVEEYSNFCFAITRRNRNISKEGGVFSVLCDKVNNVKSRKRQFFQR